MLKDLSVIILNYNSCKDTISCADSVLKIGCNVHVIIVDNVSPDGSYNKLIKYYDGVNNVTVLKSDKNGGYSYGNNYGIRYAVKHFKSKYIGILNPDIIIIDDSIFYAMCEALRTNEKLAVVGALIGDKKYLKYHKNAELQIPVSAEEAFWKIPTGLEVVKRCSLLFKKLTKSSNSYMEIIRNNLKNDLLEVDCVKGCFFVAKTKVLIEIGFLDENVFLYNEENILGIKCKKMGYTEGILLNKFYIHNHINPDKNKETLVKKITMTKNAYESTKYMCKEYYTVALVPMLAIVEIINRIYLFFAYLKNKIAIIIRR